MKTIITLLILGSIFISGPLYLVSIGLTGAAFVVAIAEGSTLVIGNNKGWL